MERGEITDELHVFLIVSHNNILLAAADLIPYNPDSHFLEHVKLFLLISLYHP